jgi:hypothetical protein
MALQARWSDVMFSPEDEIVPAGTRLSPVTLLDSVLAWIATLGILILLAGGVILAAMVWFLSVALAVGRADEGVGE